MQKPFAARLFTALLFSSVAFVASSSAKSKHDVLLEGFRAPPHTARPQAIWHWMNGNVTKDGIRKDIEWMHRIGLSGMPQADAAIDTPTVVDHRQPYMSDGWKDAYRYAAELADKYQLDFGVFSSPGWSMTGGPWVTPQQAMKKLVWSATEIDGGKPFHGILAEPPSNIGPFQNAPFAGDDNPTPKVKALHFYRDSLVIAYRTPMAEAVVTEALWNNGALDVAQLTDSDLSKAVTLAAASQDAEVWISEKLRKPATIQGVTLGMTVAKSLGYRVAVEASDDGKAWRHVADFPVVAQLQRMQMGLQTISFAPATARWFRVVLKPAEPLLASFRPRAAAAPGALPPGAVTQGAANPLMTGLKPAERIYQIRELVFHPAATVHEFEKKAMFAGPPHNFYTLAATPEFTPGSAIDPASVVVLSDKMKSDGSFDWTPPPGRWTVLRLGYSPEGKENHPAPPEATGLEVDKLNAEHVRTYIQTYLDTYAAITGPELFGKHGLKRLMIDSTEIGQQNWTENILSDFKRLRGFDPTPFLPVLTGIVVKSPAETDKFLWDFRRTIEQLVAVNHYGEIAKVAHERGLTIQAEALESHRPTFGNDLEMRQSVDVPMGAFWTYDSNKFPNMLTYEADLLGAASVAHIYGQNLVGAESLTSDLQPWAWAPGSLKSYIDMEFVRGVNLPIIHTSVHQPVDQPPGLTLFGYGQMFNRHESWAEMAKPWIDYIARSSFLLQQGHFAADIAYFYGEEAPPTALWGDKHVDDVPAGYAFDFFNSDALINQLSVDNGALVTKSGTRYRVVYLGGTSDHLTVNVLKKLRALAEAGAVIVGKRPVDSPSLADTPADFAAAADALFGKEAGVHSVGQGKVFPSGSLAEAFAALNLAPDLAIAGTDATVLHLHRKLADGDAYFLSSRSDKPVDLTAAFRVTGKLPEIWDAVTGTTRAVSYQTKNGGTEVKLSLPANGSLFVVFRKPAKAQALALRPHVETTIATIGSNWTIAFQPGRGAPASMTQNGLAAWNDNTDPGVKYFSGEGTYTTTFSMPSKRKGAHYVLDLGSVKELAEVTLNGKSVGSVWTMPFTLNITKALKPGKNVLKVKVANLWVNRLIGDAQPDTKQKYTHTIIQTYRADAPLRPSGLLGPVTIQRVN